MLTHDEHLHEINNGNEQEFFDSIFGYLLRRQPCILKDSDGKSRLLVYYEKWRHEYINNESARSKTVNQEKRTEDLSEKAEEISSGKDKDEEVCETSTAYVKTSYRTPGGDSRHTSTISTSNKDRGGQAITTSSKSLKRSHSPARVSTMNTDHGAAFEDYLWNQSFEDLEVRVPVGANISKGNQVTVKIEMQRLFVEIQMPPSSEESVSSNKVILDEEYIHNVKVDQSTWSLCPKDHISINLEKVTPMWWDRLMKSEPAIDLKNLQLERDYNSLPDDEKAKISKIIFEKEQQASGVKINDKDKASAILKEAWDKEGSPFKGQPFDPSILQMD